VAGLPRADLAILTLSGTATVMEADLANAVEGLIQRCMRAKRLVYYREPERARPGFGPARMPEFPAYTSLAQRRADGYGPYADTVAAARACGGAGRASGRSPAEREVAYVGSLTSAARASYLTAELGPASEVMTMALPGGPRAQVRDGGCRGAAVRSIYGSVADYVLAVDGAPLLSDELLAAVESSPRFVTALGAWSRCMAGHGFRYTSPEGAYTGLSREYQVTGPASGLRRRETAVASADYQCAQRTSLLRTTAAVQHTQAGRLGATAEAQLRQITRIDAQAARRAQHVAT
jgi:hypothetical protein